MVTPNKMYFDLMAEVRKNNKLSSAINKQMQRIAYLEKEKAAGSSVGNELNDARFKLVQTCGWNAGILSPILFPKYIQGGPLSLLSRPYMFAMTSLAGNTKLTFRAGRQIGKCVRGSTKLNLEDGSSCTMEELFNAA